MEKKKCAFQESDCRFRPIVCKEQGQKGGMGGKLGVVVVDKEKIGGRSFAVCEKGRRETLRSRNGVGKRGSAE